MGTMRAVSCRLPLLILVLSFFVADSYGQTSVTCSSAIFLPPPYLDVSMVGTTANKPWADDGCSSNERSVTYRITPTLGNVVTLKSCGPAAISDLQVTVFTGSCSNTQCVLSEELLSDTSCIRDAYEITFEAEAEEYWVNVSVLGDGEEHQFLININEGERIIPPPDCQLALSLFPPYSQSLSVFGSVGALTTSRSVDTAQTESVITVLDSYDVSTAAVNVDSSGDMPKSQSRLTVSESLPFGSRVLSVLVTGSEVVENPIVFTDDATAEVQRGQWAVTVGSVSAQVMTTYEASSVATRDLTFRGYASGVRLSFTLSSDSTVVAVAFQDTQGRIASYEESVTGSGGASVLDIHYADLVGDADLADIERIVVAVAGANILMTMQEFGVIGSASLPPMTSYTLPCSGTELTSGIVWYKIYPTKEVVTVSTCNQGSSIATDVGAYIGDCSEFLCISYESESSCDNGASITYYTEPGTNYISVSGRDGATGVYELVVSEAHSISGIYDSVLTSLFGWTDFGHDNGYSSFGSFGSFGSFHSYHWVPPVHDGPANSCSTAIEVTYGQSDVFVNDGLEYRNLCGLYCHGGTSWFEFTPHYSDRVKIDVCTSNFDTVLAVVDGCDTMSCMASNDDGCGDEASYVIMNVTAGRSYLIMVGGYNAEHGSFRLNINSY